MSGCGGSDVCLENLAGGEHRSGLTVVVDEADGCFAEGEVYYLFVVVVLASALQYHNKITHS